MSGSRFLKFSVYAAIFIILLVYLFGTLSFDIPAYQHRTPETGYVPYSTKELRKINITKDMLMETLQSWRFDQYSVSDSPKTFYEGSGHDLKTMILKRLSQSSREITPEQYSVVADLTGVYNLSRSDNVKNETIDYPILSPYNSFIISFETYEPFSVSNITYPPSAEFSLRFLSKVPGTLRATYIYKGHTVEQREYCEFDWFFGRVCNVYDVVKVRFEEVYTIGGVSSTIPYEKEFVFSRAHRGCVSQDYSIKGFTSIYLTVSHCRKPDGEYLVSVHYYVQKGQLNGYINRYELNLNGYHGEDKLKVKTTCSYSICYNEKTEEYAYFSFSIVSEVNKTGQKWTSKVPIWIFGALPKTFVWCHVEVGDTVTARLDNETHRINRTYQAGKIWYYYMVGAEGGIEERLRTYPEKIPEWAKREFQYDPKVNQSAEELLIALYAETARRALQDTVTRELSEIQNNSLWEGFFGDENENFARSLMEYFYLAQIPLDIEVNSSLNHGRLYTFLTQKGNESVISSLYTFFENTTYINVTKAKLNVTNSKKVETHLISVLTGKSNFTLHGLSTDCGKFAVAELGYYREPGFQYLTKDLISKIPQPINAYRGYTNVPGIVFKKVERVCNW